MAKIELTFYEAESVKISEGFIGRSGLDDQQYRTRAILISHSEGEVEIILHTKYGTTELPITTFPVEVLT
jgi:hypothetical protein